MNHNFADFEITKMLPEYNNGYFKLVIDKNNILFDSESLNYQDYIDNKYRFVWTWEDIRLYLYNKGYEINIYPNRDYYVTHIYFNKLLLTIDSSFNNYEEARRKSIIYCLNLINDERINN